MVFPLADVQPPKLSVSQYPGKQFTLMLIKEFGLIQGST